MPVEKRKRTPARAVRGIAVLGLLGLAAYGVYASTGSSARPPSDHRMAVPEAMPAEPSAEVKLLDPAEVIELRPRDLIESLPVSGVVVPVARAVVSAEVTGIAGDIGPMEGQNVRAGDLLLSIAEDDYRLALEAQLAARASLVAQLETADSALRRATELAGRGIVSDSALEDARSAAAILRANIAAAEAQIRLAQVDLDRATIRAPISGVVVERNVEPGQLVQPGTNLFNIIDLSRAFVEATVPLDQLPTLAAGQGVELWLPQDPARRFEARIERISPQAIDGTRSAIAYLGLDNTGASLPAGLFLTGRIILRERPGVLAVPSQAVTRGDDGAIVQIIRDGHIAEVAVSPVAAWAEGDLVEISSGLFAGDQVLTRPLRNLAPGDAVRIAER